MPVADTTERVETIVIGGGQAGLSVGYELARRGRPFVILDAEGRIGDAWRSRWDSLRLFTPARYDGLAGMPFPAPARHYPSKDEMADYLEAYAARFELPVRSGVRVDRLSRNGRGFVAASGTRRFEADNVVVAMSSWQRPRVPRLAAELDPDIVQLHSAALPQPAPAAGRGLLLVGAGNSGAEIALDAVSAPPRLAVGARRGACPVPHRVARGARPRAARVARAVPPRAHGAHADGPQAARGGAVPRPAAGTHQAPRPNRDRDRARAASRPRSRRPSRAR